MFARPDLELSLEIAEAMAAEFEDYLSSDDLYRQLVVKTAVGDQIPKMSAGSLLEILQDLSRAAETGRLTTGQADRLGELSDTIEQLTRRYASLYHQKLARELKSQIDSWRWFLQDCRDDLSHCREDYPFEVRIRNRIAILVDALGDRTPADQISRLERLDQTLQGVLTPSEFILDRSLQDRYPRDRYWWLYGQPAGTG